MSFPNDLYDLSSSAGILLRILLFGAVTIIVAQVIETLLERYLRQASIRLKVSPTKYLVLRRLVVAAVYVTGIIILIYSTPQLQTLSVAIFTSVSIIGIIVGIAAQSTISNVIAGIAIVVFKPFGVGDFVTWYAANLVLWRISPLDIRSFVFSMLLAIDRTELAITSEVVF